MSDLVAFLPAPMLTLQDYLDARHANVRDGGITVDVGASGSPKLVNVASDEIGRGLVSGCCQLVGLASANSEPAPTFKWVNNDGSALTLSAPQMMSVGFSLGAFVQSTYAILADTHAAITDDTITTFKQIDEAAWPANS